MLVKFTIIKQSDKKKSTKVMKIQAPVNEHVAHEELASFALGGGHVGEGGRLEQHGLHGVSHISLPQTRSFLGGHTTPGWIGHPAIVASDLASVSNETR